MLAGGLAPSARAKVFASREEALAAAFPQAERVEAEHHFLSEAQKTEVERIARAPLDSRLVTVHVGRRGDAVLGYAFLDLHTVRTLPEALLVVLAPDGSVRSLRVLAFHEPPEYLPPPRWLQQFEGRSADARLRLQREVHGIAGSTLSAQAVTRAVRRVLALYQVVVAGGE